MNGIPLAALLVAGLALGACTPETAATDPGRSAFRRPDPARSVRSDPAAAARSELGRALFFDGALSGPGDRPCSSCHRPDLAWGDGLPMAAGLSGKPLGRKTPTLLNLAGSEGPMGWDGKFRGIDAVAFGPIANPDNMGSTEAGALAAVAAQPGYREPFERAFGDAAVTRPRVEAALGAFIRGLVSAPTRFDRWVEGNESALADPERRGFDLFRGKAGCASCHSGWAMTDGSFHDVGTGGSDPGRGRLFPGSMRLLHAWKTPGLREIGKRGPYMHDGSIPTLEAVVEHYDAGGGTNRPSLAPEMRPLGLSADERADLVAFLKTLDSEPGTGRTALNEASAKD